MSFIALVAQGQWGLLGAAADEGLDRIPVGVWVALITAIPAVMVTLNAWRERQVNPKANGTDWIAEQWEKLLDRANARAEQAEARIDSLEKEVTFLRRERDTYQKSGPK